MYVILIVFFLSFKFIQGYTPLHIAMLHGHKDVFKLLAEVYSKLFYNILKKKNFNIIFCCLTKKKFFSD